LKLPSEVPKAYKAKFPSNQKPSKNRPTQNPPNAVKKPKPIKFSINSPMEFYNDLIGRCFMIYDF
jgi:hypothetical protein